MFIEKFVSLILLVLLGGFNQNKLETAHAVQPGEKVRLPSGVEFEVLKDPETYARMPSYGNVVKIGYANCSDCHDSGTKIG